MAIGVNGRVGAMQNNIMTCRKIAGRSKSAAVDGHIARTQRSGCTGTYNRMINDKAAAEAVVAIQCQSPTADIHATGAADGTVKAAIGIGEGQILAAERYRAIPRQITDGRAVICSGAIEGALGHPPPATFTSTLPPPRP